MSLLEYCTGVVEVKCFSGLSQSRKKLFAKGIQDGGGEKGF